MITEGAGLHVGRLL